MKKTYKTTEGSIVVVTTKGQGIWDKRKMLAKIQTRDRHTFANVGGHIGILCLQRNHFTLHEADTLEVQQSRESFLNFLKKCEDAGNPVLVGLSIPGLPRFIGNTFKEIVNESRQSKKVAA